MIFTIRNVIRRNLPKSFILENVANFARIDEGKALRKTISRLESIKDEDGQRAYEVTHRTLNTADEGLPQSRRRLYIVS